MLPHQLTIREFLSFDKNVKLYRPEFNKVTGNTSATLLLLQIIYRWEGKPFYKFKEPCNHQLYKASQIIKEDGTIIGDSWTEEMGFSRSEFDNALARIATKVKKGADLSTIDTPIYFYTTIDRVTYYGINESILNKWLSLIYVNQKTALRKPETYDSVKQDSALDRAESRDRLSYTKNTTNIDNKKINKKETMAIYDITIQEVFNFWKEIMNKPKAVLDPKRARTIFNQLKTYSVDDLKKAIIGCSKSKWHMGHNPNQKLYNDISNIFGDSSKLEGFRDDATKKTIIPANLHDLSTQPYDEAQEYFDVEINCAEF